MLYWQRPGALSGLSCLQARLSEHCTGGLPRLGLGNQGVQEHMHRAQGAADQVQAGQHAVLAAVGVPPASPPAGVAVGPAPLPPKLDPVAGPDLLAPCERPARAQLAVGLVQAQTP